MQKRNMYWPALVCLLLLSGLVLPGLTVWTAGTSRAAEDGYIRQVRSFEMHELGLQHPGGLAISPDSGVILVSEGLPAGETRIVAITPHNQLLHSSATAVSDSDLANLAIDPRHRRLLRPDGVSDLLGMALQPDWSADTTPGRALHFPLGALNLQQLHGMTVDPATGELFLLDSALQRVIAIRPTAEGNYDAAPALAEGRVTSIDLKAHKLGRLHGLAYHPGNGHLYLLDQAGPRLHEMDRSGAVLVSYDLSGFGLITPQALVIGLSADLTDDPDQISIYVADLGTQAQSSAARGEPAAEAGQSGSAKERRGSIVEFSLTPLPTPPAAPTTSATLVHVTATSDWAVPAPDPSGIAYEPGSNTLVISDSEVEESPAPYWQGKNVWRATLAGAILNSWTTWDGEAFSDEPTGVAYNPANGHVFYTDDNAFRLWEANPGPDSVPGTADDVVTWLSTPAFGCVDPEGVSYDPSQGHLFIADGEGAEVWELSPGPNGVFDGVAPAGDDSVTHFDTTALGLVDPESVEYDRDNGHLYVLSTRGSVIETTREGVLIQTISLAAASPKAVAGLAYAPASANPSTWNFYIVARGVDNGPDPYENDGRLYEMVFPGPPPPPTSTPTGMTLIPVGAVWKYLDNGSNQGTAWRAPGFVDTSWASGPAELGYGDGHEATVISYGPDPNNKYRTTYFRRTFDLANPAMVTALRLRIVRDDGAVVYLNGTEVFRTNMFAGNITYLSWAAADIGNPSESTFYSADVNPALLIEGTNVVAVELHQGGRTTSDASFNFELFAFTGG